MSHSREITLIQVATILISTIIGVGVLRLPLIAVRVADTGAPLITVLAGIVSFIGVFILIKLGTRFPNQSFMEYSEMILGKWLGRLYGLSVFFFFLALTGFAAREFGAVVVTSLLTETPLEVTVMIMLVLAAIFTRDDLNTFAYIHNFYVPVIFFPGLIIVVVSLKNANPLYLQPLFGSGSIDMAIGVLTITALFQGAFILTILIPAMERPQKVMRSAIWGLLISGSLFVVIVIATLAVFGPEELKKTMWPTLELSRATSLPGNILQRLDVIFLAVWVTAVFTTIFSSYMFVVQILKQTFRVQDHKPFSFFLLPIVFVIAMIPGNTLQMYKMIATVGRWGLLITIVFPMILLMIAKIRKLPARKEDT